MGETPRADTEAVETPIATSDGAALEAVLRSPPDASGVAIFVHGSGSSRHSPRNVAVAGYLERRGFATLLFDLLSDAEAHDRRNVFDIDLLARRLVDVTRWTRGERAGAGSGSAAPAPGAAGPRLADLPLAYFGASTGAAAALRAAATLLGAVAAVVSRGGRPDLAGDAALAQVTAPTLLIVGGDDREVLELNERAAQALAAPHRLEVVPGATHLFEEPGALEQVERLAGDWLERNLAATPDVSRTPAPGNPPSSGRD